MKIRDLVYKNRSYRRFYQDRTVDRAVLEELIDLGRLSASGSNLQPLKYIVSCDAENNRRIFPYLAWAGYLEDWSGPVEGERPSAYIIILGDTSVAKTFGCDHGIAAQSILLGAAEKGLGGCMIGSLQRKQLAATTGISSQYEILLVIALGVPKETVRLIPLPENGSIKYYRSDDGVHYVPKRSLSEIILN